MAKRALPSLLPRTMLLPVLASRLRPGLRPRARGLLVGALALGTLLPPALARAQAADDSGWFDAPAPAAPPEPYYQEPIAAPAAQGSEIADTDASALTVFRPALDPYGSWVADPTYGTVWVPHSEAVGADFAPYVSRGRWALTKDDDWIWVSDYPFGWAVFHYGRWVWISGRGWAWVPGRTYANAWVVWRVPSPGYAYVGWAPMPPSWVWFNGAAVTLWYSPPLPYVFCPSAYIFHGHVHYHIVRDRYLVHRIARHTRVYPTPYRAPARPAVRSAAAPNARPAPSAAPRGPRLSAARVPAAALPAERAAPPANAARLAGARRAPGSGDFASQRSPSDVRLRSEPQRLPADARRPISSEPVRRSSPAPVPPSERRSPTPERARPAPERLRPAAPERMRAEPRSLTPAPSRPTVSPSRDSLAPVRARRRP